MLSIEDRRTIHFPIWVCAQYGYMQYFIDEKNNHSILHLICISVNQFTINGFFFSNWLAMHAICPFCTYVASCSIYHQWCIYKSCKCNLIQLYSSYVSYTGIILGMGSANESRRYNVTSSLIGWAQTQFHPIILWWMSSGGWSIMMRNMLHTSKHRSQTSFSKVLWYVMRLHRPYWMMWYGH